MKRQFYILSILVLLLVGLIVGSRWFAPVARVEVEPQLAAVGVSSVADQKSRVAGLNALLRSSKLSTIQKSDKTSILTERKILMTDLARRDPRAFLDLRLSEADRRKLSPEELAYVERDISLSGTIEVLVSDDFVNKRVDYSYYLSTPAEKYEILPTQDLPASRSGEGSIRGVALEKVIVVDPKVHRFSLNVPSQTEAVGAQRLLVIPVHFSTAPVPAVSRQALSDFIFEGQYARFVTEVSSGRASVRGTVTDWLNVESAPVNDGDNPCTLKNSLGVTLDNQVVRDFIRAQGLQLADFNRVVFLLDHPSYLYGGCSLVGASDYVLDSQTFHLSQSWISTNQYNQSSVWGAQPFRWANLDYLLAHELGHAFGLSHAQGYDCGSESYRSDCESIEYGNPYDAMGSVPSAFALHYGPFYKELLGWLRADEKMVIEQPGTYTIAPLEATSGVRYASIIPPNRDDIEFAVEYRRATGFDANLARSDLTSNTSGLFLNLLKIAGTNVYLSHLLDLSPTAEAWATDVKNVGLGIGLSRPVPETPWNITLISADAASATFSITSKIQKSVCAIGVNDNQWDTVNSSDTRDYCSSPKPVGWGVRCLESRGLTPVQTPIPANGQSGNQVCASLGGICTEVNSNYWGEKYCSDTQGTAGWSARCLVGSNLTAQNVITSNNQSGDLACRAIGAQCLSVHNSQWQHKSCSLITGSGWAVRCAKGIGLRAYAGYTKAGQLSGDTVCASYVSPPPTISAITSPVTWQQNVTITGANFASTGNDINFSGTKSGKFVGNSTDGKTLTFTAGGAMVSGQYVINVSNVDGSSNNYNLTVLEAPKINLWVNGADVAELAHPGSGKAVTLAWNSRNLATGTYSCAKSGNWTGVASAFGAAGVLPPNGGATYILTCTTITGASVSDSVRILPLVLPLQKSVCALGVNNSGWQTENSSATRDYCSSSKSGNWAVRCLQGPSITATMRNNSGPGFTGDAVCTTYGEVCTEVNGAGWGVQPYCSDLLPGGGYAIRCVKGPNLSAFSTNNEAGVSGDNTCRVRGAECVSVNNSASQHLYCSDTIPAAGWSVRCVKGDGLSAADANTSSAQPSGDQACAARVAAAPASTRQTGSVWQAISSFFGRFRGR